MKRNLLAFLFALMTQCLTAQNPYMPLWEHIPDGEPYVFEDPDKPGNYRLYVYGSHDDLVTTYCGLDQVVWSAPVEDLSAWRYDGVCFTSTKDANGGNLNAEGKGDLLYAPDIVEVIEGGKKVYYFTPNNQAGGRNTMVAKGDRPDGPFKVCNWAMNSTAQNAESSKAATKTEGCFYFDPAIMIDDNGRAYGYWGFKRSYAAELDTKTMCSPKPGTQVIEDMIPGYLQQGDFRFFEASSIRKVMGKYVFIYSRFTKEGEFGLPMTNNTLAYAYSDKPLGPWTYGGTIIDGRARGCDEQGKVVPTGYCGGNTHGSICEINGRWWVFYHRHTGTSEFARQAMVAPIEVKLTKDGRLAITEGEVTSEGFRTEGLNPFERTAAGWACHFTGPTPMTAQFPNFNMSGSYPAATHNSPLECSFSLNIPQSYMTNNTDGSIVGYKYFNLSGKRKPENITLHLLPLGIKGEVIVMLDSPYKSNGGTELGRLCLSGNEKKEPQHLTAALSALKDQKGKHALYLLFQSSTKGKSLCDLYDFIFN